MIFRVVCDVWLLCEFWVVGLGLGAPWAGRSIAQQLSKASATADGESAANRLTLFDRGIAIWVLAGLVVVLPVGIIGLQNLLR